MRLLPPPKVFGPRRVTLPRSAASRLSAAARAARSPEGSVTATGSSTAGTAGADEERPAPRDRLSPDLLPGRPTVLGLRLLGALGPDLLLDGTKAAPDDAAERTD